MSALRVLFDTSIYIPYLRGVAYRELIDRAVRAGRVLVSSVVLAELYVGARSAADKADLDVVLRGYEALRRLVVPNAEEWARAGQAIRRYQSLHGKVEPRDHLNDVLILVSGARAGAEVVTENGKHFLRWASLLRRMAISARVREVRASEHLN